MRENLKTLNFFKPIEHCAGISGSQLYLLFVLQLWAPLRTLAPIHSYLPGAYRLAVRAINCSEVHSYLFFKLTATP